MTKSQIKDLAIRALWTFAQAFLAALLVTPDPFSKMALIAGVAAGLSALKTLLLQLLKS